MSNFSNQIEINSLATSDIIRLIPIPLVTTFGAITNGLNIAVFANSKMQISTFRYMLATSINDFIYLTFCMFLSLDYCVNCSSKTSYIYSVYLLLLDDYFTSCQAVYCILIEIVLSIQRYKIVTNKTSKEVIPYKVVLTLLLIPSLVSYLPILFVKEIKSNTANGLINYQLIYKKNGNSDKLCQTVYLILSTIRMVLGVFVLSFINIKTGIRFSKIFHNKITIKNELQRMSMRTYQHTSKLRQTSFTLFDCLREIRASRNMTLLVMVTCALNFAGMLPHILVRFLKFTELIKEEWFLDLELTSTTFLLFSHSVTFFVYFNFNCMFHSILINYFRVLKKKIAHFLFFK